MENDIRKQIFHSIEKLPFFLNFLDDGIKGTRDHYSDLLLAKPKPHVLDDETVDACTKTYMNQAFYIECHERQGAKWKKEAVTEQQRNDTQKFLDKCKELRELNDKILSLLTELRKGTINRILEMDDAELGLRFMMGDIKLPK